MKKHLLRALLFAVLAVASLCGMAHAADNPMDQGMALFYQQKFTEAVPFFQAARQQDPKNVLALNFLLYSAYKTMSLPTVQQKLEEDAVQRPNDPVALGALGIAYVFRAHIDPAMTEEANTQFKEALTIDPNCAPAQSGMGLLYYDKRMMPRARGHFLKAVENNAKDAMALERLGEILMVDEKKPEQAADLFRRITTQMPDYPDAHYYLGSAMYDQGQYDDAVKELKVCSDLDPHGLGQGFYAMTLAGDAQMKKKAWNDAATWYKNALALRPDSEYAKVKLTAAQNGGKLPDATASGTPKKTH